MENVRVLVVDGDPAGASRLERLIAGEGFHFTLRPELSSDEGARLRDDCDILIVRVRPNDDEIARVFGAVRGATLGSPLQIIGIADNEAEYPHVIELGADDVVAVSASDVEFAARLRAAGFRLADQERLAREREFFRRAVSEEEEVSARILDRNRMLAHACRSLESIKRELERTNDQLQKLASYDVLSGLLNRLALFSTMDMEIERSVRLKMPLSGFMSDIDNFKNINDNWGHPSGDRVIRAFSTRLTQSLRKYDRAGRYGGEEFFVILPNAGIDRAQAIAERFRRRLVEDPVSYGDGGFAVTASIGVAEFKTNEPRDAWLTRADQAMYLAKQQGRDRVCVLS